MPNKPTVNAAKKKPLLERELTVDGAAVFKSSAKALLSYFTGDGITALSEVPELISAIGLKSSVENKTWDLVTRGYRRALCDLLAEYFRADPNPVKRLKDLSWSSLQGSQFSFAIDRDFFDKPTQSPLYSEFATQTEQWLASIGIPAADARNLSQRLRYYFPAALHREWRSSPAHYSEILQKVDTPFWQSTGREAEWENYRLSLQSQVNEPVFDESFGLNQIYIPARGYFEGNQERDQTNYEEGELQLRPRERRVVRMSDQIRVWLDSRDKTSAVRLISGGPGSGKSSFCKILAADLCQDPSIDVIFIPLHLLDLSVGVQRAIGEYLQFSGFFSSNPIDEVDGPLKLLVLDGLDELQMQGKAAQAAAQSLVGDVLRLVDRANSNKCRLMALISGREIAVQSAEGYFKNEGEILHLVPYFVPKTETGWIDPDGLLKSDQRNTWWKNYGKLTGLEISGTPPNLLKGELGEVTTQPLLNYLVALAYKRGDTKLDAATSINSVYGDLLDAVHDRGWAKNPHPAVHGIDRDSFRRLLEEVALSVWHGAGRTTTLREVHEHCKRSSIAGLLPSLEAGATSGVSNLLLAFYFRQKGRREDGDQTFEFTHKSFAEYLISLRIVRALEQVCRRFAEHSESPDEGWDGETALGKWLEICGPTRIDEYVLAFIRREIALKDPARLEVLQSRGSELFSHGLAQGWPISRLSGKSLLELQRITRNAEETLFACLNACARVAKRQVDINWPDTTSFGSLIKRAQGQRRGPKNVPLLDCLSYVNADHSCLDMADLFSADLSHASLVGAELHYTVLARAKLDSANLQDALFLWTNLESAEIKGCKFSDFRGAHDRHLLFADLTSTAPNDDGEAAASELRRRGAVVVGRRRSNR